MEGKSKINRKESTYRYYKAEDLIVIWAYSETLLGLISVGPRKVSTIFSEEHVLT